MQNNTCRDMCGVCFHNHLLVEENFLAIQLKCELKACEAFDLSSIQLTQVAKLETSTAHTLRMNLSAK